MSLFGDFEHHLQRFVGDYITISWLMFNWDVYEPQPNIAIIVIPWLCGDSKPTY